MTSGRARPLRVLANPASRAADDNVYINDLYAAVRAAGDVEVIEFERRRLLSGDIDVVHVHWPEYLIRWQASLPTAMADVVKVVLALSIARRRGATLVWTAHDVRPHELHKPRLGKLFTRLFDRRVDLVISLAASANRQIFEAHPALRDVPVQVVHHGHYRDSYPRPVPRSQARTVLGLDVSRPVILMLGQIRRYKNAVALAEEVAQHHPELHLVLAGRATVDPGLADDIEAISERSANVSAHLDTVSPEGVTLFHSAADVVVLPYELGSSLHSGAALLALSMSRPVVVPDTPVMRELQRTVGKEWVRTFDGEVAAAVHSACELLSDPPVDELDLSALDWPRLGEATLTAYRASLDTGAARRAGARRPKRNRRRSADANGPDERR